jgi:hypothetical protein
MCHISNQVSSPDRGRPNKEDKKSFITPSHLRSLLTDSLSLELCLSSRRPMASLTSNLVAPLKITIKATVSNLLLYYQDLLRSQNFLKVRLKEESTWLKGISKVASTRGISGKTCVMVLECFTIRMEACTRASGGTIGCKARENCTTSLESWPTKAIGSMISSKVTESSITSTQKLCKSPSISKI